MTMNTLSKLQNMLDCWPSTGVVNQAWLREHGVSYGLANHYVKSGWLQRLSPGVFKRPSDTLTWQGALAALQTLTPLDIHVGGLTALNNEGFGHYARLGGETLFLFGQKGTTLPKWYKAQTWAQEMSYTQSEFLPPKLGVRLSTYDRIELQSSSPERAILEALHASPKAVSLLEIYDIMDGMRNLRPNLMASLLQSCASYKVKRLFAFMARKLALPIITEVDLDALNYGTGVRAIVAGGVYDADSKLMLPRDLMERTV
jgi:hypothetical protein